MLFCWGGEGCQACACCLGQFCAVLDDFSSEICFFFLGCSMLAFACYAPGFALCPSDFFSSFLCHAVLDLVAVVLRCAVLSVDLLPGVVLCTVSFLLLCCSCSYVFACCCFLSHFLTAKSLASCHKPETYNARRITCMCVCVFWLAPCAYDLSRFPPLSPWPFDYLS